MYAYDDNGNLTTETDLQGTTTYIWDTRNRLASISTAAGQTISFFYDFDGNLIQQWVNGTGPALTQNFILDDLTNIVHASSSDGDQLSVLTGRMIDQHFAVIRFGGQVEFGLSDTINSTVVSVSQSESIGGRFFYEPFGQTTSGGSNYPFQYTGRVPVIGGLYHYRARYYDPIVERFISEDPFGSESGLSLYAYVDNSPINRIDPLGLQATALSPGIQPIPSGGPNQFLACPPPRSRSFPATPGKCLLRGTDGGQCVYYCRAVEGVFWLDLNVQKDVTAGVSGRTEKSSMAIG